MKTRRLLLPMILLCLFTACDLDGFLFNDKELDSYKLPGNTIPGNLIEQVTFTSGEDTLYGYWIGSDGRYPDFTILYCHGNKHHIDEYWDRVILLHKLGVNVFIFDYRGFGLSSGEPSEAGLYRNGESAIQFIRSNYGVTDESLCIYGYSLGNVVSIYLAAEKSDPVCLIAEAPFASANSLTQG
ncbi:alpha/beta hydrolase, partial [Candidatus Latescibacterota bacterium]